MSRSRLLAVAAAAATLLPLLPGTASAADADVTRDGDTPVRFADFHSSFADESMSSPAYGDVTGDGAANIVVGGMDGRLAVIAFGGGIIRHIEIGPGAIHSSPTLADLDGDGVDDIVVGTTHGDVVAVRGDGRELFRKRTCTQAGKPCDIYSSPAVGDLDADGRLEIVVTSDDHYLHAWETDGSNVAGFPIEVFGTTWASPAIVDLDFDGFGEIVIAVDINDGGHPPIGCQTFGAWVGVYEHDGTRKWRHCIPGEIITASPAVVDVDQDGRYEIAVGSGMYFAAIGRDSGPSRLLRLFDARNGTLEPGWPVDTGGLTVVAPAVGDLDGNGDHEIVAVTDDGYVIAYEHTGAEKWRRCVMYTGDPQFACPFTRAFNALGSTPSIADVDNDGAQEVVAYVHTDLMVLRGSDGAVESRTSTNGRFVPRSQPTIVEHAGEATILTQQVHDTNGDGRYSAGDDLVVTRWSTGRPLGTADWPMFAQNARRTGSPGAISNGGEWIGPWIEALYADLLQRSPSASEIEYWTRRVSTDLGRHQVALSFATSDEWLGVVVDDLYQDVLGRRPDAGGRAYWIARLQSGTPAPQVVASFFASDEYFEAVGGTNPAFVDALFQAILRRSPDASGRAFWIERLDAGTRRGVLSTQVFRSYESGGLRVDGLYDHLLDRSPDSGGRDYWARYLTSGDEVALAAQLASSPEYVGRAEWRFGD